MLQPQSQSLIVASNSVALYKSPISIKTPSSTPKRYKPECIKYTIETAIDSIGIGLYQIPIFIVIGCLYAANSAEIMMLSFLLPITQNKWNLKDDIQSVIAGVVFTGIILSVPFWTYLLNKHGRKSLIILCTLGQNIIGISTAFAVNIYMMICLKFMVGFFLGASVIYFTILAEYIPTSFRGKLLLFQICCWSIGSTVNAILAWICMDMLNWRWYIVLSYGIPLCIISFFLYFLNESPVYLLSKGEVNSAKDILIKAAKWNQKHLPNGSLMSSEKHIAYLSHWNRIFHPNYGAIYVTSIILYVISFVFGFCYYGICFFSVVLLQKYSVNLYWIMAVIASSEFLSVFTWLSLDNCGRKFAFIGLFGIYLYSVCSLMLASIQNNVILVIIFVFFGRMGIFSSFLVLNVYMNEYYKTNVRDTAMMIEILIAAFGGIITSFVSQTDNIQWTLYIYALTGLVAFIAAFRIKQDTKNEIASTRMPLIFHSPRSVSTRQVFNEHKGIYEWIKIETKEEAKYVFEKSYTSMFK